MQKSESVESFARPIPMSLLLMTAVVVHLPLLLMKLPLKSYDANFHIFFASHYLHHWFDPWNPKWYAGFSQTTYPPLPQQWVALLSRIFGLDMAYMAVQMAAILLLVVGVYRFAKLWVSPRAASYAALASVFLGAESFLVYSAGQLGTTSAAPLYLNGLPFLFDWVRRGSWRSLLKGCALVRGCRCCSPRHAALRLVLLRGSRTCVGVSRSPGGRASFNRSVSVPHRHYRADCGRGDCCRSPAVLDRAVHYPVTQTPIPHPSRANYILSPIWGLNYFVVPYGALILALPFIFIRGSMVARLRPLLFGFWVAFLWDWAAQLPLASCCWAAHSTC